MAETELEGSWDDLSKLKKIHVHSVKDQMIQTKENHVNICW